MINSAITLKSTVTLLISLTLIQFLQLTRVRTLTADIDQSNNSTAVWKRNVVGRTVYTAGKHSTATWKGKKKKKKLTW